MLDILGVRGRGGEEVIRGLGKRRLVSEPGVVYQIDMLVSGTRSSFRSANNKIKPNSLARIRRRGYLVFVREL